MADGGYVRGRRLVTTLGAVTLALSTMAACGDDDDDDGGGADTTSAVTASATDAPVTTGASPTTAGAATTQPAGSEPAPTGTGAGGEGTLTISGFAFPADLTVTAGTAIPIVNEDDAPHTVTADDESFLVEVDAGGTAELVVDEPGSYEYHCDIHPDMTATLIVE